MDWDFKNKELIELYTKGKSRKYKDLPQNVITKFVARIGQIEAATNIYDLWNSPALKFEKLKGSDNLYSIRVDLKWRLEIEIQWEDDSKKRGIFFIKELSNHYGE